MSGSIVWYEWVGISALSVVLFLTWLCMVAWLIGVDRDEKRSRRR